jgi:release factor glutamine methyltransferase
MMRTADARTWARSLLSALGGDFSPESEADAILERVLGAARTTFYSAPERLLAVHEETQYCQLVTRRAAGEPLAYILGEKEFYGRSFLVSPAVLIPRPETELLVERSLAHLSAARGPCRLIDIGTGSGAILLSILAEAPERLKSAVGVDTSLNAIKLAVKNAELLSLSQAAVFINASLLSALCLEEHAAETLIASNPPYVPDSFNLSPSIERYEPREALRAGANGMDVIAELLAEARCAVQSGARLLFEIGHSQRFSIECEFRKQGLSSFTFWKDLGGCERVAEVWG